MCGIAALNPDARWRDRFSFDRETQQLWAADVGQYEWEEIDVIRRGGNYGWRIVEGLHCFMPSTGCDTTGLIAPIAEYGHQAERCSITGGYEYRGGSSPALRGSYIYGDYCSGEIFVLNAAANARPVAVDKPDVALQSGLRVSSFGVTL